MKRWMFFLIAFCAPAFGEAPPSPYDLPTDWWGYIEVEGEVRADHISQLEAELRAIPVAHDPELKALITSALANLVALQTPAAEESAPPSMPHLRESYTPIELLRLERLRREVQERKEQRQAQIAILTQHLEGLENRIRSLQERYAESPTGSRSHLAQGLEIIALRASIALRERDLSGERRRVEQLSDRGLLLQQVVEQAMRRLEAGTGGVTVATAAQALSDARHERIMLEAQIAEEKNATDRLLLAHLREEVRAAEFLATTLFAQLGAPQSIPPQEYTYWRRELDRLHNESRQLSLEFSALSEELDPLLLAEIRALVDQLESVVADGEFLLGTLRIELVNQKVLPERTGAFHRLWTATRDYLSGPLVRWNGVTISYWAILRFFFIVIVAYLLGRFAAWLLAIYGRRWHHISAAGLYTLGKVLRYLFLIVGVMIALASLGLRLQHVLIIAGALSIGIGFGLQSVAANLISGLILLFSRNLRVNDFVELPSGQVGRVREINLFNSVVRTFDGIDVITPNAQLTSQQLVNWTRRDPHRRLRVSFSVAYGSDKDLVRQAGLEAAGRVSATISDSQHYANPEVHLVELGESSLNFQLWVWVNIRSHGRYASLASTYLWEIENSLRDHGITIPFPQRDIHIKDQP